MIESVAYDHLPPFEVAALPKRANEVRVLMADPEHFDVQYVINPHMAGNIGQVDQKLARTQWEALRATYERLGFEVHVIEGAPHLPDMVFTANQSLPGQTPDGEWLALRSHMHSPMRRPEEVLVEAWYVRRGARVEKMSYDKGFVPFEGMGDANWLPGHRLIIGGYGFRTDRAIYDRIAAFFDVPVLCLKLVDDRFYHLDTCLSVLDADTALYVPEAFDEAGRAMLAGLFPRLVEVPMNEAAELLACNGHCPDRLHFIVQKGASVTNQRVRDLGFEVVELDTSEFLKSGGSVYCMKLMVP